MNDNYRANGPKNGKQPTSQDLLTAIIKPIHTSTPIVNRMETQQDRLNSPPVSEIMKKIDHMENELRMVKQSVISNLEKQIQDLKSSLVNAISKAMPQQTYASAVQTQSQSSERNSTLQKDNKIGPHNDANTGMKRRDASNICHDHSKR